MWVNTFAGENGRCNCADLSTPKNEHELLHQPSFLNAQKPHRSRMFQESPREVTISPDTAFPTLWQSRVIQTRNSILGCSRWRAGYGAQKHRTPSQSSISHCLSKVCLA